MQMFNKNFSKNNNMIKTNSQLFKKKILFVNFLNKN